LQHVDETSELARLSLCYDLVQSNVHALRFDVDSAHSPWFNFGTGSLIDKGMWPC